MARERLALGITQGQKQRRKYKMTTDQLLQKLQTEFIKSNDNLEYFMDQSVKVGFENYDNNEAIIFEDGYQSGIQFAIRLLKELKKEV